MAKGRLGTAYVSLRGDTKPLTKDLKDALKLVDNSVKKMERAASRVTFTSMVKAAGLAIAAIAGLVYTMDRFIVQAEKQERAEKKLEAVFRSTGNAAGFTAKEMYKYASALQRVTTFGDEEIINGMAVLATFTNVQGDAFLRATEAAMDMSTVLEQDLKSSMTMIGKALNDPLTALSAMTRAGVQFTESQKEQVKALWNSGRQFEAQAIILAELEREYGGAAKAVAEGIGGWKQLKNIVGDLFEAVGKLLYYAIAPFIPKIREVVEEMTAWINKNNDLLNQDVEGWVSRVTTVLGLLYEILKLVGIVTLGIFIGNLVGAVLKVTALASAAMKLVAGLGAVRAALNAIGVLASMGVKGGLIGLALWGGYEIGKFLNSFEDVRVSVIYMIGAIDKGITTLMYVFKELFVVMKLGWYEAIDGIKKAWVDMINWLIDAAPERVKAFLGLTKMEFTPSLNTKLLEEQLKQLDKDLKQAQDNIDETTRGAAMDVLGPITKAVTPEAGSGLGGRKGGGYTATGGSDEWMAEGYELKVREAEYDRLMKDYADKQKLNDDWNAYQLQSANDLDAALIEGEQSMNEYYNKSISDRVEKSRQAAEEIESVFKDSFVSPMEDFVTGTKTAKEAFNDFAEGIIRGLIRIAAQKMAEQIFSGIGSSGAGSAFSAIFEHTGGTAGYSGIRHNVPASAFFGAPRLHNGLNADEFPAVLQKGEEVIPKDKVGKGKDLNITIVDERSKARTSKGEVVLIVTEDLINDGAIRKTIKNVL